MKKKEIPLDIQNWHKNKWGTEKLPIGGAVPYHSSYGYKTGNWSARKPFIDQEKCTGCLNCFFFCPDSAIEMQEIEGKYVAECDFNYCNGCGICVQHCPVNAIEWTKVRWHTK